METAEQIQQPFSVSRGQILEALRNVFGFPQFRMGQEEVIQAVLAGRDTLAVMPTGSGKSLCYQLPSLLMPGTTLVVSPLIALMKDQVDALSQKKIRAAALNSSLRANEQEMVEKAFEAGILRLLYVAPERLASPRFWKLIESNRVSMIVVDEAHCVSYWGHDFRPDYMRIREAIERIKPRSTLALTATATPRVRAEIAEKLGLQTPKILVNPFDRPNIELAVAKVAAPTKMTVLRGVLERLDGSCIIYVSRRKDAEQVAEMLREWSFDALPYHAGMKKEERTANQDAFLGGLCKIMVATVAFGMGIDKPDIRAVIHYAMPSSLDAFYQECGRAGRDGLPSLSLVLFTPEDREIHEWFIRRRTPSRDLVEALYNAIRKGEPLEDVPLGNEESRNGALNFLQGSGFIDEVTPDEWIATDRGELPPDLDLASIDQRNEGDLWRLDEMIRYCEAKTCRRKILLDYFGERKPRGYRCERCDRCGSKKLPLLQSLVGRRPGKVKLDASMILREVLLDPVLATLHTSTVARVLTGSDIKRDVVKKMKGSRWFGVLRGRSRKEVSEKLLQLRIERPITAADPPPRIARRMVDFVRRYDGDCGPEAVARLLSDGGYSPGGREYGRKHFRDFGALSRHPQGQIRGWLKALVRSGVLKIVNGRVMVA
jgi:ATP-dependent DNA helicase RecQ